MSASDHIMTDKQPGSPAPVKRKRFAGERAGAWLFAASFSVGMWGLALKVLSPSHPHPGPPPVLEYAMLVPSGSDDGRAAVVWAPGAMGESEGYPDIGGVPVVLLTPPDGSPSKDAPAAD